MNSLAKYHANYQGLSYETQRELTSLRLIPVTQESLELMSQQRDDLKTKFKQMVTDWVGFPDPSAIAAIDEL